MTRTDKMRNVLLNSKKGLTAAEIVLLINEPKMRPSQMDGYLRDLCRRGEVKYNKYLVECPLTKKDSILWCADENIKVPNTEIIVSKSVEIKNKIPDFADILKCALTQYRQIPLRDKVRLQKRLNQL